MPVVNFDLKDRIGFVTLNRPEKRNALNPEMVKELTLCFQQIAKDDSVKVVILKATGKTFCAGADLAYLQQLQQNTYEENLADSQNLSSLFYLIYSLPKVVIAQVEGSAIAGGCGLATVCDFIFSTPKAKFGYTEVKIGFVAAIVMIYLTRKIGESCARHLLLSGLLVDALKAEKLGLIYEVCDKSNISQDTLKFAQILCEGNSPASMTTTKEMLERIAAMQLEDSLKYAVEINAKTRNTPDCQRGILAFLNKEPIIW